MQFLGCLLIVLLAIVLTIIGFGLSLIQKVLQGMGIHVSLFKLFDKSSPFNTQNNNAETQQTYPNQNEQEPSSSATRSTSKKNKIFSKEDGDYVDFEEVKE